MGMTWTDKITLGLRTARTAYLWGRSGIGKTYSALNMELPTDAVSVALTLLPSTQVSELRGQYHLRGGDTEWRDGVAVNALGATTVVRLVLNELPNASDEALAFLYPLLESPETASIVLPDGRVIRGNGHMQVVATGNEALDTLNPVMRDALRDRIQARLHMPEPFAEAYLAYDETWRATVRDTIRTNPLVSLRSWSYAHTLVTEHAIKIDDALTIAFDGLGFDVDAFVYGAAETIRQTTAVTDVSADCGDGSDLVDAGK